MNFLIELLFPRRCPLCDKPVDKMGRLICKKCEMRLRYIESPFCMKCGKALKDNTKEYCVDCECANHVFDRSRALYEYDSVKEAIYRFKYGKRREYVHFFGKQLSTYLGEEIEGFGAEAIIPVPLHKDREKSRGYNQAALLAGALSEETGIPVLEDLVLRTKATVPQKELKEKERQNNLKNAFKMARNDVKLKTIIVVDDIYTTGATMDEMAMCLKNAGAKKVYGISLAIGKGI